jgi:3-oxoacyl-[acyl-carrier-protein] synthase-3
MPQTVLTSEEIVEKINMVNNFTFEKDFIENVTGIKERRVTLENEHPSTLAYEASLKALESINLDADAIDTLIFASASSDILTPATANIVCDYLGSKANCFDVSNACNSFLTGLHVASLLIESEPSRRVLVCTGESTSKALRYDFENISGFSEHFTGVTFGDGGAAAILEHSDNSGFLFFENQSFPSFWADGGVFAGGSRNLRDTNFGFFRGDPVKLKTNNEAITELYAELVLTKLSSLGLGIHDFKFVLTHQITSKSRKLFQDLLGCSDRQVVPVIEKRGNLTSASLPTQLASVWGEVSSSDMVLLISVGGGISAGMTIWQKP